MNNRLREILRYKTHGKQKEFAELLGWSPQYLTKLLRGNDFGLRPILAILTAFPEINARWLLLGEGQMLEVGMLFDLQRQTMSHILAILELEKYIPIMTGDELREYEEAIRQGRKPSYDVDKLTDLSKRLDEHTKKIDTIFSSAIEESDKLCKQKTAKK